MSYSDIGLFTGGNRKVFIAVFLMVHLAIASQIFWLGQDILQGNGASERLTVSLRYPPMRIPATPIAIQYQAEKRLCADFALIYFPSQNRDYLRETYAIETTLDPWSRPSRYPPLLHLICSYTLCQLPYGAACLVHLAIETIVFWISFVFVFYKLKIKKYLWPGLLLLNACLFLTPVGLSFYERGQYTLYVGLCYLWLLLFLITGKRRYSVIAALFGFLKWTAFPFVLVVFTISFIRAENIIELKRRVVAAAGFAVVVVSLLFAVPADALIFVNGLFYQELTLIPMGNSLARILPLNAVKLLPFILILLGSMSRFCKKISLAFMIPFFVGAATILVTYPTFAFDYCVPYLTAFIPFLIYWANLPSVGRVAGLSVQYFYYFFLLLASYALFAFRYSESMVIMNYVVVAILMIGVPFFLRNICSDSLQGDADLSAE